MKKILYVGNKLKNDKHTVTTIDTLSTLLKSEEYNVVTTSDKKNKVVRLLDMILTFLKNHKEIDYLLIDTYSTFNFYYALILALLAKWFKVKYIPILHGGNLPSRLLSSPKLSQIIFNNSYKNVAPSNYLKSVFENNGFKTLFIPNVLEIDKYHFKKRISIAPKLLYVRSFSSLYNPQLAIKVLSLLLKTHPEAKLCMIGPDKDGSLLECKILAKTLGIENSVEFTGMLSKSDWHKKSEEFDIFINTTNFDNTPVSIMEAMALGLIVISTNVGGMPYMLNSGFDGVLVAPNNPEEMTLAIQSIIVDKVSTRNMIVNARKKVESFDWKKVKQSWIEIL